MPRETFRSVHSDPDHAMPVLSVGWGKEYPDIEIGVTLDSPEARASLAQLLSDHTALSDEDMESVLDALTQPHSGALGWYAHLERAATNRLIATLRRARNAAFGADE